MNPPKLERNKQIIKLKDKNGLSFFKIAKIFNISRQTAHEIYHREKEPRQD